MCHLSLDGKMYQQDSKWNHGRLHFVGYEAEDGSRVHMTRDKSEWLRKLQVENDSPEAIAALKRMREVLKEYGIEDLTGGRPFTITVPSNSIEIVKIPAN